MKSNKKVYGILLAFLALSLCWSSCSVEQSTYSIDDIPGRAIIKGKAYYNKGQKIENGVYKQDVEVAKNQRIYVDIPNSAFTNFSDYDYYHNSNRGYITFSTTTDSNGYYELEIPATTLSYGTNILVYSEDFTDTQTVIQSIENGNGVYKTIETIYRYPRTAYRVYANENIIRDIKFEPTERISEDSQFIGTTPIKIKVGFGEIEESAHYVYGDPYFSFRSGIEPTLTLTYNSDDWYQPEFEIKYTGKTNEEGELEVDALLQKSNEYVRILLSVPSYRENKFLFPYYNYNYGRYEWEVYTGTYRLYNYGFVSSQDYGNTYLRIDGTIHTIEARMVLEADPGQSDNYRHERYGWDYTSFPNN